MFAQPDNSYVDIDFPGSCGFHVSIEQDKQKTKKAPPYTYSQILDKLFIQLDAVVAITFRMQGKSFWCFVPFLQFI